MPTIDGCRASLYYFAGLSNKVCRLSEVKLAALSKQTADLFEGIQGIQAYTLGVTKRRFSGILIIGCHKKIYPLVALHRNMSSESLSHNLRRFLSVRIDANLLDELDNFARKQGIRRGCVVRIALTKLLQEQKDLVA